jgi:hypothetical protein
MPGTRTKQLERLLTWRLTEHYASESLLWLSGLAGLGKTSIAASFCRTSQKEGALGASFFCRYLDYAQSDPRRVIPTLAYRFARRWPPYAQRLVVLLEQQPDIASCPIADQMLQLFVAPLKSLKISPTTPLVFVVDALDECGSFWSELSSISLAPTEEMRDLLIEQLLKLSTLKAWVKVFVTGRPELKTTFTHFDPTKTLWKYDDLHSDPTVDLDIESFFRKRLPEIRPMRPKSLYIYWPTPSQISSIVKMAQGLFIWAEVLRRYLEKSSDPVDDLIQIIKNGSVSEGHENLQSLYTSVLDRAIGNSPRNQQRYKQVVGFIIATSSYRPLSAGTLAELLSSLHISPHTWVNVITYLSAVIFWKSGLNNHVAEIYHRSFTDFVLGWAPEKYRINMKKANAEMARACLEITVHHPIPNDEEGLPNTEDRHLLSYGSEHWCMYLKDAATDEPEIQDHIESLFFDERRSFWWLRCLEALHQLSFAPWYIFLVTNWVSKKVPVYLQTFWT